MGSIHAYINVNNPDLLKYESSLREYQEKRLKQCLSEKIDACCNKLLGEYDEQYKNLNGLKITMSNWQLQHDVINQ